MTILIWLLVLPTLGWAVVRLGGWERGPLVQLFAFTPYVAGWSLLPLALALIARRWTAGAVAVVAAAILIARVLPRALPSRDRGPAGGVSLSVMTANTLFGQAEPVNLVTLVRDHDIAVLALQEFTVDAREALAKAGLDELLPYLTNTPEQTTSEHSTLGSVVYSRFPIAGAGIRQNPGGDRQAYGTIQPPGAAPVLVESAHPAAPWSVRANTEWRVDLRGQPGSAPSEPPRILLGDFNATLDHAPLGDLIRRGYRDAAATDGKGLVGTWGPYAGKPIPPVTIDHILVDRRIAVGAVSVHGQQDSDHRVVIATLRVPQALATAVALKP
jgi:endonuclease/exonuclease/phosphatase family metal-dependent hydrolase